MNTGSSPIYDQAFDAFTRNAHHAQAPAINPATTQETSMSTLSDSKVYADVISGQLARLAGNELITELAEAGIGTRLDHNERSIILALVTALERSRTNTQQVVVPAGDAAQQIPAFTPVPQPVA